MSDFNVIEYAMTFAISAFAGKLDKSGYPAVFHSLNIGMQLTKLRYPSHVVVTAILHDVVEDTEVTLADVEDLFGSDVSMLVDTLTRREGETYRQYLERVKTSNEAVLVKAFDINDNLDRCDDIVDEKERESLRNRWEQGLELLLDLKTLFAAGE